MPVVMLKKLEGNVRAKVISVELHRKRKSKKMQEKYGEKKSRRATRRDDTLTLLRKCGYRIADRYPTQSHRLIALLVIAEDRLARLTNQRITTLARDIEIEAKQNVLGTDRIAKRAGKQDFEF